MARPLRYDFPFALHHVISRGDNRRKIVWDDADRAKRLDWLARGINGVTTSLAIRGQEWGRDIISH